LVIEPSLILMSGFAGTDFIISRSASSSRRLLSSLGSLVDQRTPKIVRRNGALSNGLSEYLAQIRGSEG